MHAVRRRAYRLAWKGREEQSGFNPFAVRWPIRRIYDVEEDLDGRTPDKDAAQGLKITPVVKLASHTSSSAFKLDITVGRIVSKSSVRARYTSVAQARLLLFNSWSHLLFLFIPVGFAANYCHFNPILVFVFNFIAIIPSAMALALAVDELSLCTGELLEGLISMTFSNAVQLITSIFLLRHGQVAVLKTALIGAILSNLLLMTGLGFLIGGIQRFEQYFNVAVAQLLGSLLLLSFISLMVPTASHFLVKTSAFDISRQSRATAIMLLISYVLWLIFQLKTHPGLFRGPAKQMSSSDRKPAEASAPSTVETAVADTDTDKSRYKDQDDKADEPRLALWNAIGAIIVSTLLIAFNTQFATDSINGLLDQAGLSTTFVGLVILPHLSNDPTTLKTAYKDRMDLSVTLTMGKCMQMAMMVIPLVIIIAWGMGVDEMTLSFNGFEIVSLFAAILIVNYIVQDGKSNWIQGALLVEAYIIVSITAFFVP